MELLSELCEIKAQACPAFGEEQTWLSVRPRSQTEWEANLWARPLGGVWLQSQRTSYGGIHYGGDGSEGPGVPPAAIQLQPGASATGGLRCC